MASKILSERTSWCSRAFVCVLCFKKASSLCSFNFWATQNEGWGLNSAACSSDCRWGFTEWVAQCGFDGGCLDQSAAKSSQCASQGSAPCCCSPWYSAFVPMCSLSFLMWLQEYLSLESSCTSHPVSGCPHFWEPTRHSKFYVQLLAIF